MRILLLNWRDIRSPRGGGAERVTHEIAMRLVERGHEVTWLSSSAADLPADENVAGVRVVRRGSELTSRFHAPSLARALQPDVVVEEINTLPYLAPLWSRAPVLLYVNQLARNVWWHEASLPVATAGWLAEPIYLQPYRRTPAITISSSTRDDLRSIGLRARIDVMPMAVHGDSVNDLGTRARSGRLVAIGRLTPSKRFAHAIEALADLRRTHPDARLDIVGSGREHCNLWQVAQRLRVVGSVSLHGRVEEEDRDRLLMAADVLVGTSVREGWGLTVTEAARVGTPSVAYDIPGFRDSIVDGRTGYLTALDPSSLAAGVRRLLADPAAYDRLRQAAWEAARGLTWETTADAFARALDAALSSSRAS